MTSVSLTDGIYLSNIKRITKTNKNYPINPHKTNSTSQLDKELPSNKTLLYPHSMSSSPHNKTSSSSTLSNNSSLAYITNNNTT